VHVCKRWKERGSRGNFEGRRRGMPTTWNGATQSATCCTMCKGVEWGIGHKRLGPAAR